MHPIRRLTALGLRSRLPRRTVRLRLTAVYGGLFLVSGAALLAITYVLVDRLTDVGVFHTGDGSSGMVFGGGDAHAGRPGVTAHSGPAGAPLPTITPAQAQRLAAQQHAAEMRQLLVSSGIALAIMVVIAVVLGWLVAGRVLRPLRSITTSVRDISATNLHERLTLRGPDDELRELGDTFNGLLTRLDTSFQAQRRFIANASHELRTPLARQRALAQVALADPDADAVTLRVAHERVLVAGQQQERLIDALLVLARGQAGLSSSGCIDLARIAWPVVAEAERGDIDLRCTLDAAPVSGDSRLVERLVVNLVDNALRYNGPGGHVEVRTGVRGGQALLTVSNSGPVVPAADVDRLLQPFQRLGSERVGTGAGLGLSIVAAIADAHGATLTATPRPTGGLCIEVAFAPASGGVVEDEAEGEALTRADRRHAVPDGSGRPAPRRLHRAVAGREHQPVPVRDEAGVAP
jgi:signal transduction histidine kinase